MYVLFRVPIPAGQAAQLEALRKDDIVSRQSIEVRDANALGLGGGGSLILIEGTEAGIARAEEVLKGLGTKLTGEDAEKAYARFRSQEDDAAAGMGLVFGP